jgi:hypothetical protein
MSKQKQPLDPSIHRVRLEKLTIFEISEAELEALERGSPESLFLNLGIAAISIAVSFLTTLMTTAIADIQTFCVFVIVCSVGFLAGATFGLLWWQARKTGGNVAHEIRSRIPPIGVQENAAEEKSVE